MTYRDTGTIEDAALIVRAVNNHERLVNALKEVCNHVVACERGGASSLELTQAFFIAEQVLLELEQEER